MSIDLLQYVPYLIVFVAAVVQASTGIGYAMICAPLLAMIDPALVPGPMLVSLVFLSALMAWGGRREVAPREFIWLLPGLITGTILGVIVVAMVDRQILALLLGVSVLVAVAVTASGWWVRLSRPSLAGGGAIAGLMGTISGIHGPPLAVLYLREAPAKSRATIAWVFLMASLMSLAGLAAAKQLPDGVLPVGTLMAVAAALGVWAARFVRRRVSVAALRVAMLVLCAVSAGMLIGRTLLA